MYSSMRRFCVVLIAVILLAPMVLSANIADDAISELKSKTAAPTDKDKVRETTIDLSVPKSPAFTVLGVTPENVVRPTSPRAFAAALLQGAGPNGNIQTGIALETAPYLLYAGNNITLKEYQDKYGIRFFSRTQLSLATVKGANDEDEATRIALGLTVTPFDRGDPRNSKKLIEGFKSNLGKVTKNADKVLIDMAPLVLQNSPELAIRLNKEISKLEEQAKSEAKKVRDKWRKENWNASSWSIGIAPTWTSPTGNTGELEWSGAGIWTSLSYGFEEIPGLNEKAQVLLHARYRENELAPDPQGSGTFFEQDTTTIAGQARIAGFSFRKTTGGPDFNFPIEAAYVKENRKDRSNEELFRYTIGIDYRITDDLYLDFSLGNENGREEGGDSAFGMITLKWGFSDKPKRNIK